MGPNHKSIAATPVIGPAQLASDPELVEALLSVCQAFELGDQLRVLLERANLWSGARCGLALGLAEERRALMPIASTEAADDPRLAAFDRLDPQRVRKWVGEGVKVFEGLGPFAELNAPWPEAPAAASVTLAVLGPSGTFAGVLWLVLDRKPEPAFVQRMERLLELARAAVGNALQVRSMRELVIKDDTAHCFNRRHFETCLPEELARASRFQTPLSLIFLDMDNLKEVNKRHGHAMGSRSLAEVSTRIRSKIRRFDKLYRFGGDEFCILLPETEWHGALEVAERVRDAIARQPFLVPELGEGFGVRMTASLGIASFPLHSRSQKDLIEQADRAMQRIKSGTKNSIGIAEIVGDEHGD